MHELSKSSDILYQLSQVERKKLRSCLLEIYNDIKEVCAKYSLSLMVSGGTALGAMRHKGFIPWDDDLDVMMPRKDYNKLLEVFEKELSDGYYLYAPNTSFGCTNTFAKIMKKNTTLVDLYNSQDEYKKGIYVDIFPIENTPNSLFLRIIKGLVADVFAYIAVSVRLFTNNNELMLTYVSKSRNSLSNYTIRMFLGAMFSFVSYEKWYNLYDRYVQTSKLSDYCTIPTGRKHYRGEILKREIFLPPSEGLFEGIKVPMPNNANAYLENLYGNDYMQIPPSEERERHYFIEINFDNE